MRCDVIAEGVVAAVKEVGLTVPLVVRLEGTNVEQARKMLTQAQSEIPSMIIAKDLTDAAKKVTESVAEPAAA